MKVPPFYVRHRQKFTPLFLSIFVLVAIFLSGQPVRSVELGVAAHSPAGFSGGEVIPASCPSYSHLGTDCNAEEGDMCFNIAGWQAGPPGGYTLYETPGVYRLCCPTGYVPSDPYTCVPACAGNYGQQCSGSNQCGTLYGSYQCNGACSVGGPTLPPGFGQGCNSPANACGQTTGGTIGCNGACTATTPPAVPANYGQACASSPNFCGQTYTGYIQCNGSCSAPAPPNSNCPPSQQPPSISVNPTSLLTGQSTTITWNCPGNSSATGTNFSTGGAASGQATVVVTTTTTYTVTCQAGTQASAQATVNGPALSLTASPTRVKANNASTLTWLASSVTSCALTGPGINVSKTANASGTITQQVTSTGAITGQSIYTLTCQSTSGQVSSSVTVNLIPSEQEI